jgi:hypothetical protein
MIAPYQVASASAAGGVAIALLMAFLFVAWVATLFLMLGDPIPVVAKLFWLLAATCLAPFAIPVYILLRHHRHAVEIA